MSKHAVRPSVGPKTPPSPSRVVCCVAGFTILSWPARDAGSKEKPPYHSTVRTSFDIIHTSDPSTFAGLEYMGRGDRKIRDKRVDNDPIVNAFLFVARYDDGTSIEIAVNPEYETKEKAQTEAVRFANPLGQLPTLLRAGIHRFSVHMGKETFHAATGHVVVYSGTADKREHAKHLEESLFHEAVHASLDEHHRLSDTWRAAQVNDGRFLTSYAQTRPEREDLAETALFAYAILHHAERFPSADTADVMRMVPNRIEYIKRLFPPGQPIFYRVGDPEVYG